MDNMMTTEHIYQLARTRSELLNHIKSRKLRNLDMWLGNRPTTVNAA